MSGEVFGDLCRDRALGSRYRGRKWRIKCKSRAALGIVAAARIGRIRIATVVLGDDFRPHGAWIGCETAECRNGAGRKSNRA